MSARKKPATSTQKPTIKLSNAEILKAKGWAGHYCKYSYGMEFIDPITGETHNEDLAISILEDRETWDAHKLKVFPEIHALKKSNVVLQEICHRLEVETCELKHKLEKKRNKGLLW